MLPFLPSLSPIHRRLRVVAIVAVIALAGVAPLSAQTREDVDRAKAEQEAIREQAADVAARIDALNDEASELLISLDLLEISVAAAESRMSVAEQRVTTTEAQLAAVEAELAELEAAQVELQTIIVDSAIEEYVGGVEVRQTTVLSTEDPVAWSLRQGMYGLVVTDLADARDQLRVIDARIQAALADADRLATAAQTERDQAALVQADLIGSQQAAAEVLGQVQERIERRLTEAETLAEIDRDLSEEIRRGEAEIARRLALAEALRNAEENTNEDGGGSTRKDLIARPDEIVNVRGIEIHFTMADQLLGLINAAEAAGIRLGGVGWRSTERQIELRIQNCGQSDYEIFDAPAEACFPPTARPATSNHEAGTAVDFTADGRAVVDRNSIAFQWLAANASSYGFYNLWSEPWHWSIDGR